MPRSGRKTSTIGCYHVIIRGNNKQALFPSDIDFGQFTEFIKNYLARYFIKIHHYCLMHNHVHLLLWCSSLNALSRYMHGVQRSYHHYYRKKYNALLQLKES